MRPMLPKILSIATVAIFIAGGVHMAGAETLGDALHAANVPVQGFSEPELRQRITSYAASTSDLFLLAYYVDDGSGLHPPLHLVRAERGTGNLRRADLQDIDAVNPDGKRMDCLGSPVGIRERGGTIYVETHLSPSAGCVIGLSSDLSYRFTVSGWLLGLLGLDFAVIRRSEIHFSSVSPLHVEVYDLVHDRVVEVFPSEGDGIRQRFARLIRPHISYKWCMENNAPCDPNNFDTEINGQPAINEEAKAFGFEATFGAGGFGEDAEKHVAPQTVAYIFRERNGKWQYREFEPSQLQSRFGVSKIGDLVIQTPDLPFEDTAVR